jgi:hypothetical protein
MQYTLDSWEILSNPQAPEMNRQAVRKQYDELLKPAIDDIAKLSKAYHRGIYHPSLLLKTLKKVGAGLTLIYGCSTLFKTLG